MYKYYKIKKEYLEKIFTEKELKINKYITRPFISSDNSQIAISVPENTIHQGIHKNSNWYEYCFKDGEHRIVISNLLFVPKSMRIPMENYNNEQEHIKRLKEVENNIKLINYKINICLRIANKDNRFWPINKSKQICEQVLKKEKQNSFSMSM